MQSEQIVKIELTYPNGTGMWIQLSDIPGSRVPRVGEFIRVPEGDATEEQVVRVLHVTYDLRHEPCIILDVEDVLRSQNEK